MPSDESSFGVILISNLDFASRETSLEEGLAPLQAKQFQLAEQKFHRAQFCKPHQPHQQCRLHQAF